MFRILRIYHQLKDVYSFFGHFQGGNKQKRCSKYCTFHLQLRPKLWILKHSHSASEKRFWKRPRRHLPENEWKPKSKCCTLTAKLLTLTCYQQNLSILCDVSLFFEVAAFFCHSFLFLPSYILSFENILKSFLVLNQVNEFLSSQEDGAKKDPLTVEQVAMGFITVANETMCRPIRALTEARGHDTSRHVLACFGGAGGQHACSIARSLGMSTVFIHRCVWQMFQNEQYNKKVQ